MPMHRTKYTMALYSVPGRRRPGAEQAGYRYNGGIRCETTHEPAYTRAHADLHRSGCCDAGHKSRVRNGRWLDSHLGDRYDGPFLTGRHRVCRPTARAGPRAA